MGKMYERDKGKSHKSRDVIYQDMFQVCNLKKNKNPQAKLKTLWQNLK